ncbi:hypothetical protein AB8810_11180 [Xanthomonas sp. NCPPB 3005]|uniref:hypothetical protein n=1 Tax=Xanthomonas sp. NCPPB 3005 TaxID=3240913 RepID=UPI0035146781
MYAVNGRRFRAIAAGDPLSDGETLVDELPASLLQLDPVAETKARIGAWLDSVVQARGYDNIVSCASYAASTNTQFQAEAVAAIAWRDAVYAMGYEILANTPAGVETPEDVMALLPQPETFGWPVSDSSDSTAG